MALKLTIENGIKDAMRAKDADRLRALRAIKSMILLEETSGSNTGEISVDAEMKILMKAAKQRKDSLEVYIAQNRPDLGVFTQTIIGFGVNGTYFCHYFSIGSY